MPYGYLGQNTPNQTVSNSGVFDISSAADLEKQGKFGGSLELIEEQTHSSDVSSVIFDDIKQDKYDVHLLQMNNIGVAIDVSRTFKVQFYENGTLETTSVYKSAFQRMRVDGTFTAYNTSGNNSIFMSVGGGSATNEKAGGYMYFYDLGNNSKYSLTTYQVWETQTDGVQQFNFGGGLLPQASTVDGIKIFPVANNYTSFNMKLYGVKQL